MRTPLKTIARAYCIRPLLAASLAFAIAFTIGCGEKSGGKAADNPKPVVEETAEAATQTACDEKIEAKPKTDKTAAAEAAAAKAVARFAAAQDALDEAEADASAAETEEALAEVSARLPAAKAAKAKAAAAFAKFSAGTTSFTDSRDCKTYKKVQMPDGKTWMAENLNYKPSVGNSWCYDGKNSNCEKYGRLYDWTTALKACPKGWYLPSKEEWTGLVESISGSGNTRGRYRLKSRDGWAGNGNEVDLYGFSALPGGNRIAPGDFTGVDGATGWWTATEYNNGDYDHAYIRWMIDDDYVHDTDNDKRNGLSVRCVKD